MADDRFESLEPQQPAQEQAKGLPRLNSFDHLEIGGVAPAPAAPGLSSENDILCPHCGQANENERDVCWACYKFLRNKDAPASEAPPKDVTLVLNGQTYHSTDPELPQDIRVLMQNIQKEGYSEKLLADWRSWRAARNAGLQDPKSGEGEEIKVFKDPRRSVIRMDGTLYYSDEPRLPPELKDLFDYLAANGVTPELMTHLRQYGDKVKFRPHTTAAPSDGCVDFWRQVDAAGRAPDQVGAGAEPADRSGEGYPEQLASIIVNGTVGVGIVLLAVRQVLIWHVVLDHDLFFWKTLGLGLAFDAAVCAAWFYKFGRNLLDSKSARESLGAAALIMPMVFFMAAELFNCWFDSSPSIIHDVAVTRSVTKDVTLRHSFWQEREICVKSWRGGANGPKLADECFPVPRFIWLGIGPAIPRVKEPHLIVESKPGSLGYEWVSACKLEKPPDPDQEP